MATAQVVARSVHPVVEAGAFPFPHLQAEVEVAADLRLRTQSWALPVKARCPKREERV
jgi:hypothetical protein